MDDIPDGAAQPACPTCGVVMRDVAGGYRCGSCGHVEHLRHDGRVMPAFTGMPSIHRG